MSYLIVFCGAGLGGMARHGVNQLALRAGGLAGFPVGTLAINIVGSFAMGLVVGWFAMRGEAPQQLRLFLTTGIIGGFTTFSAFSIETAVLYERGALGAAAAYVVGSVLFSLGAVFAGLAVMRLGLR